MSKVSHSLIYITITVLPLVINYFLKLKYKNRKAALKNENDFYHQSIFINMKNFHCKQHIMDNIECNYYCSNVHLKTLRNFISSAKKSICICMYTFTLKQIHLAVIKAHENGVHVRIITDRVMMNTDISRFNFNRLKDKGIYFKIQPSDQTMMHHKYCLIDKDSEHEAKMFFGSTNLTCQAIVSNFDSYIFTNNKFIIERYNEEFEELWESFC